MRIAAFAPITLTLGALALTACDVSAVDESVKIKVRQQLVATCTATATAQVPAGVTVDIDRVCACTADKIIAGKSARELVTNPPTAPEDFAVVQECVGEIGPVKIDTTA